MRMLDDLNDKQIQLDSMGADHTEERIERVLKGLGFESSDMTKPLNTFSGGWQMRVELAKFYWLTRILYYSMSQQTILI